MALQRLVEEPARLGGLGEEVGGVLLRQRTQLGDALDDVHVDAEHRVHEEFGHP